MQRGTHTIGALTAFVTLALTTTQTSAGIIAEWRFSPEKMAGLPGFWGNSASRTIDPDVGSGILEAKAGPGFASSVGDFAYFAPSSSNSSLRSPDDGSGALFSLQRESRSGNQLIITVDTTGYQDITFSFDQIGSTFRSYGLSYSTDGVNYTGFGGALPSATTNWVTSSVDLSSVAEIENVSNVYFLLQYAASQNAVGKTVDNIVISAAIPAPASGALLALSALPIIRRRR